jgi:hypothetical protein
MLQVAILEQDLCHTPRYGHPGEFWRGFQWDRTAEMACRGAMVVLVMKVLLVYRVHHQEHDRC